MAERGYQQAARQVVRQVDLLDTHVAITNEALALFIRFWLTANPPLPDTEMAAVQAKGKERYDGFVEALARRMQTGMRLAGALSRDVQP